MRILFISGQPEDGAKLSIDQTVSLISARILSRRPPNLDISFYSDLGIGDIRERLRAERPDIVHVAGHSDYGLLRLRNESREVIEVNGSALSNLIPLQHPPKLLVLGSCDSYKLVSEGKFSNIPAVLSFKGSIRLQVANTVLVNFYTDLLAGLTLAEAHNSGGDLLRLEQSDVELIIKLNGDEAPEALYNPPALVVRPLLEQSAPALYMLEVGLDGAPADLIQVVFFTDEREWAEDSDWEAENPAELTLECWRASRMAKIVYGPLAEGECVWSVSAEVQDRDERLYAAALRANGESFVLKSSVSAGLLKAVERGLVHVTRRQDVTDLALRLRQVSRMRSSLSPEAHKPRGKEAV